MSARILVTGASGTVGREVVRALAAQAEVVAVDVRPPDAPVPGVAHAIADITDPDFADRLEGIEVVLHLAAVVTPRPGQTREDMHRIDVDGTANVVRGCVAHGVRKLVYTSSGAAYGYHPDNPPLLTEAAPLRGNHAFAYAWHKREVEALLATARAEHPDLQQLVFRVSTVLGTSVHNQITGLFEQRLVPGLRGVDTPFCFVDDRDVVRCLVAGALGAHTGIYNLTGDGVMTLREVVGELGGRVVPLPAGVLRRGLAVAHRRGLTRYGPEQLLFLQHRPVLANERLKADFGQPLTSRQAFARYRRSRV